ncbi:MAG: Uncharacterised protein [Synechococcus sp. CC9902]|nr:MAG: Uncharacterised protein [Synechococcus sp. CC9902]
MGIEENQSPPAHGSKLFAQLHNHGNQQPCRQGEGAGEGTMLRGKTDRLNRQTPDRRLLRELLQDCIQQSVGEQRISDERKMGAVLFTGTEGPDQRGPIHRNGLLHLWPAQLLKATASGFQRHA